MMELQKREASLENLATAAALAVESGMFVEDFIVAAAEVWELMYQNSLERY